MQTDVKGACDTCAKQANNGNCRVLKRLVGKTVACWAWSSDPDWEEKAEAMTRDYAERRDLADVF